MCDMHKVICTFMFVSFRENTKYDPRQCILAAFQYLEGVHHKDSHRSHKTLTKWNFDYVISLCIVFSNRMAGCVVDNI